MVFFLALTPLYLAALGGGTLFTALTGCVCMGCYSGDQASQLEQGLCTQYDWGPDGPDYGIMRKVK